MTRLATDKYDRDPRAVEAMVETIRIEKAVQLFCFDFCEK